MSLFTLSPFTRLFIYATVLNLLSLAIYWALAIGLIILVVGIFRMGILILGVSLCLAGAWMILRSLVYDYIRKAGMKRESL